MAIIWQGKIAKSGKIWQGKIKQDLARYDKVRLSKIWQDMANLTNMTLVRLSKIWQVIWLGKIKQDLARYDKVRFGQDLARYDKVRFAKSCQILPCQDLPNLWQGNLTLSRFDKIWQGKILQILPIWQGKILANLDKVWLVRLSKIWQDMTR